MRIYLKRYYKGELLKRIRELESEGWECVHQVKELKSSGSSYELKKVGDYGSKFRRTSNIAVESVFYMTMEKRS